MICGARCWLVPAFLLSARIVWGLWGREGEVFGGFLGGAREGSGGGC